MADTHLHLQAITRVRLTKLDSDGNVISVEEHEETLTEQEARELWHSQQQA